MNWQIVPLEKRDRDLCREAAERLVEEFRAFSPNAWPTLKTAEAEVDQALHSEKIAYAAIGRGDSLLGWIGGQPQYSGNVWELHPLAVRKDAQGQGVGRSLVARLEKEVRERGGFTLWLGTDDEAGLTSIGGVDLYPGVLERLAGVESRRGHPVGFFERLGFEVTGVVPDANGLGRPDILMSKRVAEPPEGHVWGVKPTQAIVARGH